ncbi:hypothetical protein D3C85_1609720 [compost metagenome]
MYKNPANVGFFYDLLQDIPHAMGAITASSALVTYPGPRSEGRGGKQLLEMNQARYAAEPFNRWWQG